MTAIFDGNDGNDGNSANAGGAGNATSISKGWFFYIFIPRFNR